MFRLISTANQQPNTDVERDGKYGEIDRVAVHRVQPRVGDQIHVVLQTDELGRAKDVILREADAYRRQNRSDDKGGITDEGGKYEHVARQGLAWRSLRSQPFADLPSADTVIIVLQSTRLTV